MSTPVTAQQDAPAGYNSQKAKQTYQTGVLIASIAFFVLSTGLPMAISLATSFSSSRAMVGSPFLAALTSSPQYAFAAGRIWFLTYAPDLQTHTLQRMPLPSDPNAAATPDDAASDIQPPVQFAFNSTPRLLGQGDKLWIIEGDRVGWVEDGTFLADLPQRRLGELSQPFLFRDKPAVLELAAANPKRRAGLELLVLTDGEWDSAGFLVVDDGTTFSISDWRIVPIGETLYVFRSMGSSFIEYLEWPIPKDAGQGGIDPETDAKQPAAPSQPDDRWQRIVIAPIEPQNAPRRANQGFVQWAAMELDDAPAVFHLQQSATGMGTTGQIVGKKFMNGKWTDFFSHSTSSSFIQSLSACPLPGPSHFALIFPESFSRMEVIEVENGNVVATVTQGQESPFSGAFGMLSLDSMIALQGVTLAIMAAYVIAIGRLSAKYRASDYIYGLSRVPFASLERRAAARYIDSMIGTAPMIYVGYRLFSEFDPTSIFDSVMSSRAQTELIDFLVKVAWLAGFAFGWLFLTFLIFCFTEGWWGTTIGKALFRIRVLGTDLHPCGFLRALLRNILRIADMLYNAMVGLLAIALTTNQQRLGDLVARTVVVRAVPVQPLTDGNAVAATAQPAQAARAAGDSQGQTESFWLT